MICNDRTYMYLYTDSKPRFNLSFSQANESENSNKQIYCLIQSFIV